MFYTPAHSQDMQTHIHLQADMRYMKHNFIKQYLSLYLTNAHVFYSVSLVTVGHRWLVNFMTP